jgi:hypothetical protein
LPSFNLPVQQFIKNGGNTSTSPVDEESPVAETKCPSVGAEEVKYLIQDPNTVAGRIMS